MVSRINKNTHSLEQLYFEKNNKEYDVFDKVEVGETLEKAFERIFQKGYGFTSFEEANILRMTDYADDKEGNRRPRFTIEVRVPSNGSHNSQYEGYNLVWSVIPSPYEIFRELKKYVTPGSAFVPLAYKDLPQNISKYGGLPYLPLNIEWPVCKHCGKAMDFICQFSKEDFPTMAIPSDEYTHLLIFACLNEQDFFQPTEQGFVSTYWAKKADAVHKTPPPQSDFSEKRYQNPPIECKANPMVLVDYVPYNDSRYPELKKLFDYLPDDRSDYYFNNFMPFEGTKVKGEPSFIQNEEYPTCDKCGKRMEFWGQLSSDEPVNKLLHKDLSDHNLMWGDVGIIYLYYCKDWCTDTVKSIMQCS